MLVGDLGRGAETGVIVEAQRREFEHGVIIEVEVRAGAGAGAGQGAAGAGAEAEVGALIGMRGLRDWIITALQYLEQLEPPLHLRRKLLHLWLGWKLLLYPSLNLLYTAVR